MLADRVKNLNFIFVLIFLFLDFSQNTRSQNTRTLDARFETVKRRDRISVCKKFNYTATQESSRLILFCRALKLTVTDKCDKITFLYNLKNTFLE